MPPLCPYTTLVRANIKRHEDNGSNPRPDNRSGYLEGETPDVVEEFIDNAEQAAEAGIKIELWDPATPLRYAAKKQVQIGRAHVCTPVTNAQLVCRLMLVHKKNIQHTVLIYKL